VGGIVKTNFGPDFDSAQGVVVQPTARSSWWVQRPEHPGTHRRRRYLSTGALDAGFGTGWRGADRPAGGPVDRTVRRAPADGKIVVGGEAGVVPGNVAFAVVRYLDTGALDTASA
jgi:hypothetical protein